MRLRQLIISEELRIGVRTYREKLFLQVSFWSSAVIVGVSAVYFNRLVTSAQDLFSNVYDRHPYYTLAASPLFFLAATGVTQFAPYASGSGMPQVLYAVELANEASHSPVERGLISLRTACIKIISTTVAFFGGASVGAEGPTVQVSASIFGTIGERMRKHFPRLNLQSYIIAAAGAGIAAAFNTPLGGIAFALEEATIGDFGPLRHLVILAVILSGLIAEALAGGDLYLGSPNLNHVASPLWLSWLAWLPGAIVIGLAGGILGGLFCRLVASQFLNRFNWWKKALICGLVVATINFFYHGATAGSGYAVTRDFIEHGTDNVALTFPLAKLIATAFSTLSGLGGGILAPSLSIGGWIGVAIGKIAYLGNLRACALIGMVAYFTGAFRIPLTALIIVTEMTNEHSIIFPMMATALVADMASRFVMPTPLYHVLLKRLGGGSQLH